MSVQYIELEHKEYAVIPVADYQVLLEKAEMLDDVAAYDKARAELASGDDELVPAEVADALLDGENPVKVWRTHRGMTQAQLAEAAGVTKQYIGQMERGPESRGKIDTLRKVAQALGVDLDDIV